MRKYFILTVFCFLVSYCACFACEFDVDCYPGSKCVKKRGSLYGVCMGGLNPGNNNDDSPAYAPSDPNRTYGNTCSYDTDCGPGSICAKGSSIYGTCLKR